MRVILSTKAIGRKFDTLVINVKDGEFIKDGHRLSSTFHLSRPSSTFKMLAACAMRAPGYITIEELYDYIWGDRADGGPMNPENQINVMLQLPHFRTKLNWLGLKIFREVVQHPSGPRAECRLGWRVEWTNEAAAVAA